jgi:DNA-directed RNA polymerase specialized sigma subunit
MRKKERRLSSWHRSQVVELDWVAGTLARKEYKKKSLGNATDFDDLKQVALWGVCAAVYDWNPEGGKSISSYAWDRAFAYLGHYMRDKSRMIKIPRKIQKLYYNWCSLKQENPGIKESEILEILKCTSEELQEAKKVGVSTPTELFAETLNIEENNTLKHEPKYDQKSQAMEFIAQILPDSELQLCLKYFKGSLKKWTDIEKAQEISARIKENLFNLGFKDSSFLDI